MSGPVHIQAWIESVQSANKRAAKSEYDKDEITEFALGAIAGWAWVLSKLIGTRATYNHIQNELDFLLMPEMQVHDHMKKVKRK